MLRCADCGWIGYSNELQAVEESRGEFWGIPCSETMYYCPKCGSDCLDEYKEQGDEVVYDRFTSMFYDGAYLDSYDGKTPLAGTCYCVGRVDDEEGYEWRSFTPEHWELIKDMTDEEIYKTYPVAPLNEGPFDKEVPNVLD